MNRIDKLIEKLLNILENENCEKLEIETVGAITTKIVLYKPKYTFLKVKECIQFYDKISSVKVKIDIYTARELEINENLKQYEIMLDNDQYVKIKMY